MAKIAFKNTDSGTYYAFNTELSALKIISKDDTTSWNDDVILDSLTATALRNVYGMELVTETGYEDDTFTAAFTTYDVVSTTDETAYQLHGYSGINSFEAEASDDCRFLISFDGRETWYSYDQDNTEWKIVKEPEQNIYAKGMSTEELNNLTTASIKEIYKRTQLDFMVAVTTDGYFSKLTLSLPENSAPTVENIILSSIDTHKDDVLVSADVTDIDGDNIEWSVYINNSDTPLTEGFVEGNEFTDTHGISFNVPIDSLIIGVNQITIKVTDSKATKQFTVYINRNNSNPIAAGILNNNVYSASITDPDDDNIKYRILLNGEEILGWTDYIASPVSFIYEIPRDKIVYDEINRLVIEYIDDGNKDVVHELIEEFVGSCYGLLFVDENMKFYSNSFGEIIKMLTPANIVASKSSSTYIVYAYNKSNNVLDNVTITAPEIHPNINLQISYTDSPFQEEEKLIFSRMELLDKQPIYVRVVTNSEDFIGDFKLPINGVGNINNAVVAQKI